VTRASTSSFLAATFLLVSACWLASCATPFGPGYLVEKQEIQVSFAPQPEPRIHISAEYQLKNSGNQALDSLDVRLPGRRFRLTNLSIRVDGTPLAQSASPDNPRDTVLRLPSWPVGAGHRIEFAYDIPSTPVEPGTIGFSKDAFYLPAGGWTPALPQERGAFGFGGVPPKKWELLVRVPQGFLVHASGEKEKHSGKNGEIEFRFAQSTDDLNPFVVAGKFRETRQELPQSQSIRIWSRVGLNPAWLYQAGDSLSRTLAAYDSLFGARGKAHPPLWIVECPAESGCISQRSSAFSALLYGAAQDSPADMISRDTVLVEPRLSEGKADALAAPSVSAGWLGYGQNPGFYEQQLPMSALPAFAAALAREDSSGPQVRAQIIARALAQIPRDAARDSNADPNIARAKSLLLFYALRDRVGAENFQKAMQHMLSARQARGFDITDLISALEQESQQAVGPFVRQWIKRPGVPDDFRAAHAQANFQQDPTTEEAAK
jgi:hypothetical protein